MNVKEQLRSFDGIAGEFKRFSIVGIINTLVGISIILFLMKFVGLNPYISNIAGYACGLIVSFFLNRQYAFKSDKKIDYKTVTAFALCVLVSYAANFISLHILIEIFRADIYLSQFISMGIYSVVFFLLNKIFVFRTN